MKKIQDIIKGKVIIAPLAGYTNASFRHIMKEFGADLVYTEMVSSKGLIYESVQTLDYIKLEDFEKPVSVQLFGGDIDDLVKATIITLQKSNPDIIDINMGCPIKKVTKQGAGSDLLKDPQKVYEMVKAVKEVSTVPVSIKIRAGINHDSINCVEIAKAAERAGVDLICIHGRTKSDLYSGKCNLDYIKMVKDAVSVPVIGNGDIKSVEDAIKMIEYTNCDYIMVGRGCLGNPYLIRELKNYFEGNNQIINPTVHEKCDLIKYNYKLLKQLKGERIALLEMRSLAAFYFKSMKNVKQYKIMLNQVKVEKDFYDLIDLVEKNCI